MAYVTPKVPDCFIVVSSFLKGLQEYGAAEKALPAISGGSLSVSSELQGEVVLIEVYEQGQYDKQEYKEIQNAISLLAGVLNFTHVDSVILNQSVLYCCKLNAIYLKFKTGQAIYANLIQPFKLELVGDI